MKLSKTKKIILLEATIKIKNFEDLLSSNDQCLVPIILILLKHGVSIQVSGFSAKQKTYVRPREINVSLLGVRHLSLLV